MNPVELTKLIDGHDVQVQEATRMLAFLPDETTEEESDLLAKTVVNSMFILKYCTQFEREGYSEELGVELATIINKNTEDLNKLMSICKEEGA